MPASCGDLTGERCALIELNWLTLLREPTLLGMKRSALGFLFLMLAACGDSSDPPGDTATLHNGNGGSGGAQEPAPAPRANHVAVFDEGNDRMIVFDGSNSEVWQLPLSGPSANVWAPLIVKGVQPPSHDIKSFFYADSAVFDPIGQRMLVLLNASPATGKVDNTVRLWSLSLNGEPQWTKIAADGPSPGVEIQSARMAYDREGQRVFFLGGPSRMPRSGPCRSRRHRPGVAWRTRRTRKNFIPAT